jgi:hypothetical protein
VGKNPKPQLVQDPRLHFVATLFMPAVWIASSLDLHRPRSQSFHPGLCLDVARWVLDFAIAFTFRRQFAVVSGVYLSFDDEGQPQGWADALFRTSAG